MLRSYINPVERREADRKLPKLMVEGLLLTGTGLGVLALIFEIAADAFSVAAYQTLLAIHGAHGYHEIAILAFMVLSGMLFFGVVPAYKAGAYLRPNVGGSGPLVEAIGPQRMRWLSWIGTSMFFLDAILTIIISSISAADVTMLVFPELARYRIVLAELYAFFVMAVLVSLGPRRAVPVFMIGGGAFTIFTIVALSMVGATAAGNPQWAFLTEGIVRRLEVTGVVEHVVRAQQDLPAIGSVVFFQFFFRSMSSAMLGFSGYEVIPASGKHAARPKWKVINTALTLAAVFLIGTGIVQLYAAQRWKIPATEGYSTLLIEYEIVAAQVLGKGVTADDVVVTEQDRLEAAQIYSDLQARRALADAQQGEAPSPHELEYLSREEFIETVAKDIAFVRALNRATTGTTGESFLFVGGILLAIILLLAQGGGYVGGAAVAANAARLGRLPRYFEDDRIGVAVIWGFAATLIPVIREVVIVEAYYAFGFVSAFAITSTTVFFVREQVLTDRGIAPHSGEAKSLRFAGLRGMIASYAMGVVLITQKTDALFPIAVSAALITLFQVIVANGGFRLRAPQPIILPEQAPGKRATAFSSGIQRAHDEARQRGIADAIRHMLEAGELAKFNVEPFRITRLVSYLHNVEPKLFTLNGENGLNSAHRAYRDEHIEEPSIDLEATYQRAFQQQVKLKAEIEHYSHYGIFTFVDKYHLNWVSTEHGRDEETVLRAMLDILFPLTSEEVVWAEYRQYEWKKIPEPIWQFCRERYRWAKDQWPNLSDRITTIWTLQDFGLIPKEVDVRMIIAVASGRTYKTVEIHTHGPGEEDATGAAAEQTGDEPPDLPNS